MKFNYACVCVLCALRVEDFAVNRTIVVIARACKSIYGLRLVSGKTHQVHTQNDVWPIGAIGE